MRKCNLSAVMPRDSWSPSFKGNKSQAAKKPAREGAAVVSYFPSIKSGAVVMEKLRRYSHIPVAELLEADPDIVKWTSTAADIPVRLDDGEGRTVRPHFIAETNTDRLVIRIERNDNIGKSPERMTLAAWMRRRGTQFVTLSEHEVKNHPLLPVSKDIIFHRYADWPDHLPLDVAALYAAGGIATLGDLHDRLGGGDVLLRQLQALVGNGHIDIDISYGLTRAAPITRCSHQGYRR